jgi:predicted RNase H-like HicB family nuclease
MWGKEKISATALAFNVAICPITEYAVEKEYHIRDENRIITEQRYEKPYEPTRTESVADMSKNIKEATQAYLEKEEKRRLLQERLSIDKQLSKLQKERIQAIRQHKSKEDMKPINEEIQSLKQSREQNAEQYKSFEQTQEKELVLALSR